MLIQSSAAALALGLSTVATSAWAQDQAGDGNTVSEVVVTAQFREQNLQDTPIAITAVTGEMLEERSQTSLVDIANNAPNLTLQKGTAGFGPTMQTFIRGVGQSDFNFAFEPGVGIYIDDVYFSTTVGSIFDLLDLERVEVLRGPQGTLAGMNSLGGSIKMFSKKPRGDNAGFIEATYGDNDRLDFRGSADFTVIPDQLFARISGVSRSSKGYVTSYDYACTHPQLAAQFTIPTSVTGTDCKLGTEGGKDYTAVRASVRWTPTERLEINLTADLTEDSSEAIPQTLVFVGNTTNIATPPWSRINVGRTPNANPALDYPRFSTAPTNGLNVWNPTTQTSPFITYSPFGPYNGDTFTNSPYANYSTYCIVRPSSGTAGWCAKPEAFVDSWGVSGQLNYEINDNLNLTWISSYRRLDGGWAQDYDASPLSNAMLTYEVWHWQWSQEARLNGQMMDGAVNWVAGAFYFKQKSFYGGRNELGTSEFLEYDHIPATNWAVFANASWAITDKLEVNAGVRYSDEKKTFQFGRLGIPGTPVNANYIVCPAAGPGQVVHRQFCGLNGVSGSFSGDKIDWRAVVQYKWTDDIMTYASVATGFKGGGVNPRPFFPDQAIPFGPEKLTAYELGAKTQWLDRRLQLNVSVFQNDYTDFIAAVASLVQTLPNLGCPINPNELQCSFYINAGDAEVRGAEVEMQFRPVRGLSIDGAISYLDFEYKKLTGCSILLTPPPACPGNLGGLGANLRYDMDSPFSPKWKYSLGVQYEFEMGDLGSLTPRLDYSYSGSFYGTAVNSPLGHVPGHDLLNFRLTWRDADEDWSASLEVTNVTDELYYWGFFPNGSNATVSGNPAPPRQWALTVKRYF